MERHPLGGNSGDRHGHGEVPENTHWDPAYQLVEVEYIMALEVDADFNVVQAIASEALIDSLPTARGPGMVASLTSLEPHSDGEA